MPNEKAEESNQEAGVAGEHVRIQSQQNFSTNSSSQTEGRILLAVPNAKRSTETPSKTEESEDSSSTLSASEFAPLFDLKPSPEAEIEATINLHITFYGKEEQLQLMAQRLVNRLDVIGVGVFGASLATDGGVTIIEPKDL